MREIKFRAYRREWGKVESVAELYLEKNKIVAIKFDGESNWEFDQSKFELIEYTGKKDKYQKEIWEGSVLTESYGSLEPLMVGDKKKQKKYKVEKLESDFVLSPIGYGFESLLLSQTGHKLEIIGDIYSNPELITS